MSENTLQSEPGIASNSKPPLAVSTNPMNLNLDKLNPVSNTNSGSQQLNGVSSPSVQDLQGEFKAFNRDTISP